MYVGSSFSLSVHVPGGHTTRRPRAPFGLAERPDTMVMGNSKPLAACTVMMRTTSWSVSGNTVSATKRPSSPCSRVHNRYRRTPWPPASLHALAWSTTNRTRRHTSRLSRCASASSITHRSSTSHESSCEGVLYWIRVETPRRHMRARATGCDCSSSGASAVSRHGWLCVTFHS